MRNYYFYISKGRVDKLLSVIPEYTGDMEARKKRTVVQTQKKARLGFKKIFHANASYGKQKTIQFDSEEKANYTKKLMFLMQNINETLIEFTKTTNELNKNNLYIYKGLFEIETPLYETKKDSIITVISKISDDKILKLQCSITNFSEYSDEQENCIHSGNIFFFNKSTSIYAETCFMFINYENDNKSCIIGQPIYMNLIDENDKILL